MRDIIYIQIESQSINSLHGRERQRAYVNSIRFYLFQTCHCNISSAILLQQRVKVFICSTHNYHKQNNLEKSSDYIIQTMANFNLSVSYTNNASRTITIIFSFLQKNFYKKKHKLNTLVLPFGPDTQMLDKAKSSVLFLKRSPGKTLGDESK